VLGSLKLDFRLYNEEQEYLSPECIQTLSGKLFTTYQQSFNFSEPEKIVSLEIPCGGSFIRCF